MAQVGISDFKDKADLINVAMASSHIPMLLDLKFARPCRGKWCVDGSFPDFFYNDNCELLKSGGSATVFDYSIDKNLPRNGECLDAVCAPACCAQGWVVVGTAGCAAIT